VNDKGGPNPECSDPDFWLDSDLDWIHKLCIWLDLDSSWDQIRMQAGSANFGFSRT